MKKKLEKYKQVRRDPWIFGKYTFLEMKSILIKIQKKSQ